MKRTHAILVAVVGLGLAMAAEGAGPPPRKLPTDDGTNLTPLSQLYTTEVDNKLGAHQKDECKAAAKGNARPKGPKDALSETCDVPAVFVKNRKPETIKNEKGEETVEDCKGKDCCATCGLSETKGSDGKVRSKTLKNEMTVYYGKPSQRGKPSWPKHEFSGSRNSIGDTGEGAYGVENRADKQDPSTNPLGVRVGDNPNAPRDAQGNVRTVPEFKCDDFAGGKGVWDEATGTCDLSRVMIKKVNEAALKDSRNNGKKKAFDADDEGNCNTGEFDGTKAAVKCGDERRVHHVAESYTVECDDGWTLEDGMCKRANAKMAAAKSVIVPAGFADPVAMMGFTFAPPRIRWGWDYREEVCIDLLFTDFCFEIFQAFIGYDIDIAAGVRLPVTLNIPDAPANAMAESKSAMNATLYPDDFTVEDYRNFCAWHNMTADPVISSCDRFAFPEYLSSTLAAKHTGHKVDGKEFVAQAIVKAGVFVELFNIPVISVGVDAGNDYATMCTMAKLADGKALLKYAPDLIELATGTGTQSSGETLLAGLKRNDLNCASFATPFGARRNELTGEVNPYPPLPFMPSSLKLPADCKNARNQALAKILGVKEVPLCTGLLIQYGPVGMGLGMTLNLSAGSNAITANWSTEGDAMSATGKLTFNAPTTVETYATAALGPVTYDNYESPPTDKAKVKIDNMTYCLNQFTFGMDASLEFGGWLSFLPSLFTVPVFSASFPTGDCGIPIGQHHATGPVAIEVPVTNYALYIWGEPDAALNEAGTIYEKDGNKWLRIKPGKSGAFRINAHNLGSATDDVGNFRRTLLANWSTTPDAAALAGSKVSGIAAHADAKAPLTLGVTPYRHPTTAPGPYQIPVLADSLNAKTAKAGGLAAVDPLGNKRYDAGTTLYVEALAFFEPRLAIAASVPGGLPGTTQVNTLTVENWGNAEDAASLTRVVVPGNAGNKCNLTTMGKLPECPYRAWPTEVAPGWMTALAGRIPETGTIKPAVDNPPANAKSAFSLTVRRDWAGMVNTDYSVEITATSVTDTEKEPGHSHGMVTYRVTATKESMARYIGLELDELAGKITAANSAGIKTGGALPIVTRDVQGAHARTMEAITAGDFKKATTSMAVEERGMAAFVKAIGNLDPGLRDEWTAQANAIIADLQAAQASNVASN